LHGIAWVSWQAGDIYWAELAAERPVSFDSILALRSDVFNPPIRMEPSDDASRRDRSNVFQQRLMVRCASMRPTTPFTANTKQPITGI
jgi:hypothetical protein